MVTGEISMNTPINEFQDILDAMERDPALRDALRRHILTDELLLVPVRLSRIEDDVTALKEGQARLEEGQARLEGDVSTLKQGQARLEEDVSTLKQGQARLEEDVSVLKEGQARLEGDVSTLKEGQVRLEQGLAETNQRLDKLTGEFEIASGKLSNLTGEDYESHVTAFVHRTLRRERDIHATIFSTQKDKTSLTSLLDEAETKGFITARETDEMNETDLVLTVNDINGWIVAEISVTIQQKDINRAEREAEVLAKATSRTVTPFVIGARQEENLTIEKAQVLTIRERGETAQPA